MTDISKLREDALRRKQEHEELERRKQLNAMTGSSRAPTRGRNTSARSTANKRTSASGNFKKSGKSKTSSAQSTKRANYAKGKKRATNRWVIDILLVLGALLVVVYFVSQVIG